MITVAILINGQPIFARSAVNKGVAQPRNGSHDRCRYRLDTGDDIEHYPPDGAVALAIKMLQTVREP